MAPQTLPPFTLAPTTLPTTTTTMATTTTTMRPTTLLPSFNLNLNCLCVLLTACGLGYMPWFNVNSLDPRQLVPRQGQSCSGTNSVCCRLGTGRGDQVVQSNALVKFDDETIKNPGKLITDDNLLFHIYVAFLTFFYRFTECLPMCASRQLS